MRNSKLFNRIASNIKLIHWPVRARLIRVFLLSLLLTGCVSVRDNTDSWPTDLPPQAYFNDYYETSDENRSVQTREAYLKWVGRFYEGWVLYAQGWNWLSEKVMSEMDDVQARDRVRVKMAELGRMIGAEWAQDGDYRVINTSNLLVWGDAVKESVELGKEEWLADQVLADVGLLLQGGLVSKSIKLSRYFDNGGGADDLAFEDDF